MLPGNGRGVAGTLAGMALAVCLLFDRRSDRLVRGLWDRLERAGVRTLASHTHGRHRPHLSYAVLLAWDLGRVQQAVATLADTAAPATPEGQGPVALDVHGTVLFPRGRAALAPSLTAAVVRRQERVAAALSGTGAVLHRHYQPGSWVPHVSVATGAGADQLGVVARAVNDVLPLRLEVTSAALVDSGTGQVWPLPFVP